MMLNPGSDPAGALRELLAAGRYQEVLDRHAEHAAEWGGEAGIRLAVATAATRLGRLADGEQLAGGALATYRVRADDDGRMRCLNLLGAISWERGELGPAGARWGDSLELARGAGDVLMVARISNNLASALHLEGRAVEARSLYREALLGYQRLADRRGAAETAHNLALAHREDDELDLAHRASDEAVRHAELVGDAALLSLVLTGRAETRVRQGEQALALGDLDRATRLAATANDRIGIAEADRVRALRWLALGEPERALQAVEPARATAAELGSALLQADCATVACRALRALGRVGDADAMRTEAATIYRSLGAVRQVEGLEAGE